MCIVLSGRIWGIRIVHMFLKRKTPAAFRKEYTKKPGAPIKGAGHFIVNAVHEGRGVSTLGRSDGQPAAHSSPIPVISFTLMRKTIIWLRPMVIKDSTGVMSGERLKSSATIRSRDFSSETSSYVPLTITLRQ